MTPHAFVGKWRGNALTERASSQTHFNDLCALLGVLDPKAADPHGEWFTFEKGAAKTGSGGWGPLTTSARVARGESPRYAVGSVSLSKFLVTTRISATFPATTSALML